MKTDLTNAEKEVLFLITEQHLTLKQIQLRRNCTKQAVYKVLKHLKQKGALNNGLQSKGTSQPNSYSKVRLHGQEFNIRILFKDKRYADMLLKSNLMYLEGHTIKLFKNSIEIYSGEGISFYGKDEQEATSKSLTYWSKLFNRLEHELKIIIIKERTRNIKEVNHHYARTDSEICKNAIENKEQIRVFALEDNKLAFVTDDSFGFREDETLHPITAKQDRKSIDKQVNDWRINNPPTNSELSYVALENSKNIGILIKDKEESTKQLKEFAIALNRHIPAYEGMANFTKQLGNEIKSLRKEIGYFRKSESKKIKSNILNGEQKSILDY